LQPFNKTQISIIVFAESPSITKTRLLKPIKNPGEAKIPPEERKNSMRE